MINPFATTSRYYGIDIVTMQNTDGTTIAYVRRRFVPSQDRFALLQEYTVQQGDRLDNLTAEFLGDPEQFWRVCDANNAMQPDDLVKTPGDSVRITLPEGIPAPPTNA